MSRAEIRVEGFISNELTVRDAGGHRVVDVTVPHTPSKLVDGRWEDSGPTTWFEATFWNEHADRVLDSVNKSDLVILSGTAELEVYAKKDGTPGGKVKVTNPTISKVVRKPKRGESSPAVPDSWAAVPAGEPDVWNTPGNRDETPF